MEPITLVMPMLSSPVAQILLGVALTIGVARLALWFYEKVVP